MKLDAPCCICSRECGENAKLTPDHRLVCVVCAISPRGKQLLRVRLPRREAA